MPKKFMALIGPFLGLLLVVALFGCIAGLFFASVSTLGIPGSEEPVDSSESAPEGFDFGSSAPSSPSFAS